jgi:hypothetical protein
MIKETGKANGPARMLHATRRWTRAAIPITKESKIGNARYFLHRSNLHNNPGGNRIDRTQKERNIKWVVEDGARIGEQPVLLCMDANSVPEKSEEIQKALRSVWYDAAKLYSKDGEAEMTFSKYKDWDKWTKKGATRPDVVLMNEQAKSMCTGVKVRRDLPIRSHPGIEITISIKKVTVKKNVIRKPKEYNVAEAADIKDEQKEELAQMASMEVGIDWEPGRHQKIGGGNPQYCVKHIWSTDAGTYQKKARALKEEEGCQKLKKSLSSQDP